MSDLIAISLRLDKDLLATIDSYCKQTGQGCSSFIRSAAVAAMEGPVSPTVAAMEGPASPPVGVEPAMIDQGARDALQALLRYGRPCLR